MKSMAKWSLVSAFALLAVACSDDKKESTTTEDTGSGEWRRAFAWFGSAWN